MDYKNNTASIVSGILDSPKYQQIYPAFVQRIAEQEIIKGRNHKDTLKAVKNKLHQVGEVYLDKGIQYNKWLHKLQSVSNQPELFKEVCRQIMQRHASTRERLPILDQFYSTIFAELPPINSVLDLACGLNPLAIPWMPLDPNARYYACDIFCDMTAFLYNALASMPINGEVITCDIISTPPTQKVDLALVLKTIPCLEQVDKQIGPRLLDAINAKYLLVSYPLRSLGGKQKGMREHYEASFNELVEGKGWDITRFEFETELAFLVGK